MRTEETRNVHSASTGGSEPAPGSGNVGVPTSARPLFGVAALLAGLGVAAGAFGAHALSARLPPDLLAPFETGARYHLTQSLGALLLALGAERWGIRALRTAGWLLVAGVAVFAGSLYLLALTGVRGLGAVTPLGGVLLLAGWGTAGVAVLRSRSRE